MYRYAVVNAKAKQTKKRKILNKIIIAVFLLLVIAVSLAIWIYWKSMTPTILDVAETRIKSETARVVNEAVCLALSEHTDYSELVNIEKNTDNEIIMISANSSLVNTLARNTAMLSQKKINELASFDVNIPLGTLSGIPLFAEKGPKINIVVSPIGVVNCNFTSSFETAGKK